MSTDDKNEASDLPPVPVELEEQTALVSEGTSGEELPPLPPGMAGDNAVAGPAPVLRPQPIVSPAEPQSVPYSQAQKPKGKGAMVVLILALIAFTVYQGAQAWQARQAEMEAKEKTQQNVMAEAKATQRAEEAQAHFDRVAGLVKPKHEADDALKSVQDDRRNFKEKSGDVDVQHSRRRAEAEKALKEAEERKRELEEKLKEGQS